MKNKSLIFNSVAAGLSALVLGFMGLGYNGKETTGYVIIRLTKDLFQYFDVVTMAFWVAAFVGLVAAVVTLSMAVCRILAEVKVIKSEKANKVFKLIAFIASIVLVAALGLGLAGNIYYVIKYSEISFLGLGLILNVLCSAGILVLNILSRK